MVSAESAHGSTGTHRPELPTIKGWYLWWSDAGKPYATRTVAITDEQERAGCEMTIPADDVVALTAKIRNQPDRPLDEG
jgi:hypothetical protein